jgi:NAD(P)-dependent dehydrogenase (short-subunit alcohol dehydrogenase family)
MVLYTTAKSAPAGFTRAQALEWAPYGVRVNAISPASFPDVVTSREERVRQAAQRAEQTVPLRRTGRLREVGLLALYLASAEL